MMRPAIRLLCLTLAAAALVCGTAPAQKDKKSRGDKDGRNDLVGRARWAWTLRNDKGRVVAEGKLVGNVDGELFTLAPRDKRKKIGTFSVPERGRVNVTFTDGRL